MAAAPPGLVNDGWGDSGAFHCLTPKVLRQINEWFRGYTRAEKVQCLLSFVHAKAAHLAKSAELMQSIIDQGVIDSDQWVQGLARLLNGFPTSATVQCAQVDNEFVYRLIEVVKLRTTPQWLMPEEVGFTTPAPDAPVPGSPRPAEFCPVAGRSADEVFSWIQDVVEDEVGSILDLWEEDNTPPRPAAASRGFRTLPWSDERPRPSQPPRAAPAPQSAAPSEESEEPSLPMQERPRRAVPAADDLDWDVAGLEEAERAAVGPTPRPATEATPSTAEAPETCEAEAEASPTEEAPPESRDRQAGQAPAGVAAGRASGSELATADASRRAERPCTSPLSQDGESGDEKRPCELSAGQAAGAKRRKVESGARAPG